MIPNLEALKSCLFFRGKTIEEIAALLERTPCQTRSYHKNGLIANQGDPADRVGIVLEGRVEVQKLHPTGRSMTIARLGPGETFGEAVLFSRTAVLPATVVASEPGSVLFIGKEPLLALFVEDTGILTRYMENLSERLVLLNHKLEVLSVGSLRQRIAHDLLKLSREQESSVIRLPYNKRVWAEHLNAARPSLSRELAFMQAKGLLCFSGNTFTLTDRKALEDLLFAD
jgi:CRP-like cAMP-binding protein